MEIVRELLSMSGACNTAWQQICQQLNYIRELEQNDQTMRRELDFLRSQEKDISAKLNAGYARHGKRPREEVTNWLKSLEEIESDVNNLGSGDAPFWSYYYSRLKRSKKTAKILCEVKDLREKGNPFAQGENLFINSLPKTSPILPATTIHGTSAERKKEEILQFIMNPEVSKIGVYGMGGVGKTTILTQIYNELNEKKVFEIIIWVAVSSSFNLEKLQDNIAKLLGFQFSSFADKMIRAMELHEAFRRRRNFAIFLDDVWDCLSLQDVGIPEADSSNGSKIVWTTRSKTVCHSMVSQKEIKVEVLTNEEAWSLFKDKVGGEDVVSNEIEPFARKVASECRGLPLALITVGHALRREYQLPVWRNALEELKTSSIDQIYGMDKYVFQSLRFSYSRLSSNIRPCFLYCALYPEDDKISVDELIEYWMAEGLIKELGSIQTEKDKGHAYLKALKDACMIESIGDDNEYVRMHDLMRDLAINITREQPLFMVKAELGSKELCKEEEWVENLERVSLMINRFYSFQGQPNCPQLSTLLLKSYRWTSPPVVSFSAAFFKQMHNLKVLDLSKTSIESLPASLSDLVNLRALMLTDCNQLEYLPSLAKLQKLTQLKLANLVSLKELPHGIENLVELRHLDISYGGWGNFPSGALLKMSRLEILFMQSFKWRLSSGGNGDAEDNSAFAEILSLKNLTLFSVAFADVMTFNSYINKADEYELLKRFDYFLFRVSHKCDRHNAENESMEKVALPDAVNFLGICDCNFIQLSDIFVMDDLRQLVDCGIERCHEMEWIGKDGEITLPSLETLRLYNLRSLKGLCEEKPHVETLRNLRLLSIGVCDKLKYLIPIDLLVNNLQNLEEISIGRCKEMEDIISGNAGAAMAGLPKLKKLKLWDLPVLTSIYQGKLVCDSLCEIQITNCPKIKKLPFFINNMRPAGMRIMGSGEWWETLEWEDLQLKELLQPFFQSYVQTGWGFTGDGRLGSREFQIAKLNLPRQKNRFSASLSPE